MSAVVKAVLTVVRVSCPDLTRLYVPGLYVYHAGCDGSMWHGCLVCQKWHESSDFIAF